MVIDGKYKILKKIGQGGMSVVYLAINEKANKTWAVKEIRKGTELGAELVQERLRRETELLKRLRHPRLPAIADVIEEQGGLLIVMDYIEGSSLSELLEQEGPQPEKQVITWGKQLCEVLEYLHRQDPPVIYQDLKPSNVMLEPDGGVKLIDFGTAREVRDLGSREETVCLGTPGYAAPEQWEGLGRVDGRTDIYCLGALLYQLVTGQDPGHEPYGIYPIRRWNPDLSAGLEAILETCTRANPKERYESCRELALVLEHYEEMDLSVRRRQRKELFRFLFTVLLTAVCLVAALFVRYREKCLTLQVYEAFRERASSALKPEEKLKSYEEAIGLLPGREEAYLELLEQVFLTVEADGMVSFTREEDERLREILSRRAADGRSFELHLKENQEGYERLAYWLGLAYYYDYEAGGGKSLGVKWLQIAADSETLPKASRERALRLGTIGAYYSRIGQVNRSGDAGVSYGDYWKDLTALSEGNLVQLDNAVTALRMYQELAAQIHGRALEFRQAGIGKAELKDELASIREHLRTDFSEEDWDKPGLKEMRTRLTYLLTEAGRQVELAYEERVR